MEINEGDIKIVITYKDFKANYERMPRQKLMFLRDILKEEAQLIDEVLMR